MGAEGKRVDGAVNENVQHNDGGRFLPMPATCTLDINVFDGRRRLLSPKRDIFFRVIDGTQKTACAKSYKTSSLTLETLPFYDNFGDNYLVLVSAKGYRQAGFTPVTVSPTAVTSIDLMLIPKNTAFNFSDAGWDDIKDRLPFLASGTTATAARTRYTNLMSNRPQTLAALLNLTTVMAQVFLPHGGPIDYLIELEWDQSLQQDRFFAYCDESIGDELRAAADQGEFAPELGAGFFHPGATASWKQVQFGEANLQITLHENDTEVIDGINCCLVEFDIDYYKDLLSHALLEVLPNSLSGGLTNPETVYVLRWMAGRHAGVPEFDPPFTIEAI